MAVGLGGAAPIGSGIAPARDHRRDFRTHRSGDNRTPDPVETDTGAVDGQAR